MTQRDEARELFAEMARDCPWKCSFDGRNHCICRGAAFAEAMKRRADGEKAPEQ